MKKMKKMTEELEIKKSQTDRLLFEFVPPVIAEALRAAKPVPARENQTTWTVIFFYHLLQKSSLIVQLYSLTSLTSSQSVSIALLNR